MYLGRLAVLCTVFIGISVSAEAQYTSKSTSSSGFMTKTTSAQPPSYTNSGAAGQARAAAPSYTNSGTAGQARAAAPSYTNSGAAGQARAAAPSYTNSGVAQAKTAAPSYTNSGAATPAQQAKTASQPVFRPRPETAEPEAEAEEDELPSFDALEGGNADPALAQGQPQENLPPPPPPKGEIWIYVSDFEYRDLTGFTMNCNWKINVQNRTDTVIERLGIAYKILDINTNLYINSVQPGSSTTKGHALFDEKCPAMAHVRPKVDVIECKMGTMVNQDCMNYIKIK